MATAAGFEILLAGGNAFDAAIATGLALHVVEPHMNSIGGEAPALVYSARHKKVLAVSGQGTAPRAATLQFFRDRRIKLVPGDGFLPVTVPASFDLWITLLAKFGTMSLRQVIAPAIRLAEHGFPMYPNLERNLRAHAARFLNEWPTTSRIFLPNGRIPATGQILVQKELAQTFRKLVAAEKRAGTDRLEGLTAARAYFYSGPIARKIVEFASHTPVMDASGQRHTCLIALDDFSGYVSRIEDTVSAEFRGLRVHKCGPWSQGPVFLQQLRLVEGYNLRRMGHNSPDYIHLITEASKLAFADREKFYGDPLFTHIPMDALLSREYAKKRRKLINMKKASLEMTPGTTVNPAHRLLRSTNIRGDTTHLDVADAEGNMVSVTPSGGWIWSSPVIEGLGFPLGTRGQMFSLDESHPNSLAPRKRPRTTLSPTLVTVDNKPLMAFGTPGGDQQDQWTLQFFLNFVEFGMNLQASIDAPTFHNSHFPSSFYPREAHPGRLHLEGRIPSEVRDQLKRRGHRIVLEDDWVNGRVTAIHFNNREGVISAAASSRYQTSYAMGI
jgi:gamma-glutamyltranspeptidase/glutathione hydrolase